MKIKNLYIGNIMMIQHFSYEDTLSGFEKIADSEVVRKTYLYKISKNYVKDLGYGGIYHIGISDRNHKIGYKYASDLNQDFIKGYSVKKISKRKVLKAIREGVKR